MSWTDDRVELLRKLWLEGLSASQIANELGGVTRNAVIGKVHRMGLSGRVKASSASARPKRNTARAGGVKTARGNIKSNTGKTGLANVAVHKPAPIIDLPEPVIKMLNLLQLTDQTCRWPVGDPQEEDFGFCGNSPREGDPYCEYHCRLAYQPAMDRRRQQSGAR